MRLHSTVWIVDQLLQAFGVFGRQTGGPGIVEQAQLQEIEKMHLVLAAERVQLHSDQGFQRKDLVPLGLNGVGDFGGGGRVGRANFFASVKQMDGVSRAAVGHVDKTVDAHEFVMLEADRLQCHLDGVEVGTADQNIHVLRVADSRSINSRDPRGDGIASGNRVGDFRLFQCSGGSTGSFTDGFHGFDHPFPGEVLKFNSHSLPRFVPEFEYLTARSSV